MRRGLSSIAHAERPGPSGARAHFGDRVDRAHHSRAVRERSDTRAPGQQALERLEVERAVLPEGTRLQNGTAVPRRQLPRNDVRVVFELRDQHLIARPQGAAERLGQESQPDGRPACEDYFLAAPGADEPLDTVAGGLVELGGLFAERVDGAVDVGVAPGVVLTHRLDDRPRPLARRGRVEVDEGVAVDDPLEDREIRARPLVESHDFPFNAIANTDSGSVTQRIRVGRMSAWSTASTSAVSTRRASARERPTTSSARTSADAVQIAHESPTNRAVATRSPSSATISRTRSPQRGLTSSATAEAPGSSPRKRGRRHRSRMTSL